MASDVATPGTALVTVSNPGAMVSNAVFMTVTNQTTSVLMMPAVWAGAYSATAMAIGDFNGDGKLDSASISPNAGGALTVSLGNGDGTFNTSNTYPTGTTASLSLAVGDFNLDGKLDIAVLNSTAYQAGVPGNVAISWAMVMAHSSSRCSLPPTTIPSQLSRPTSTVTESWMSP